MFYSESFTSEGDIPLALVFAALRAYAIGGQRWRLSLVIFALGLPMAIANIVRAATTCALVPTLPRPLTSTSRRSPPTRMSS